jgi:hypothetical protein
MRFLMTLVVALAASYATTLEKLSFDEMVAKSTSVVSGRVTFSHVQQHGAIFYTHYKVQVTEQFKGPAAKVIDIVLPGGTIGNAQQRFSGVPKLQADMDMALFLWTSKSGLTHIIGLSQGILQMSKDASGQIIVSREAIREGMVDGKTGRAASDSGIQMTMTEFRARVVGGVR